MTKWSFSEGRGLRTVITSKNWAVSLGKMEHRPLLWTCCFPLIKNVKYTQFKITITSPVTDDKGGSQWGDRTHWLTAQACFPEETRIQIHKTTHVCRNLGGGWWNRWKKPREFFNTVNLLCMILYWWIHDTMHVSKLDNIKNESSDTWIKKSFRRSEDLRMEECSKTM